MKGETDLAEILKTMKPELNEGEYVFCTHSLFPFSNTIDLSAILGFFKEKEGVTVIVSKTFADKFNWEYTSEFSWITLSVHSSLDAVGLTAVFSGALAEAGISCNVLAAFYHDHIFVGKKDAGKAMDILRELSRDAEAG